MNTESIELLAESISSLTTALISIKISLWIISGLFFEILVYLINEARKTKTLDAEEVPMFDDAKAEILLAKGEHKALIEFCSENIQYYPNDVRPNWYSAFAHFQLGNLKEASVLFEKVASLSPSYKKAASLYLEEISELSGNSNHSNSH